MIEVPVENILLGVDGFRKWMNAYRDAPDDADIEIAVAESDQIEPSTCVSASVNGLRMLMSPEQAMVMADTFEAITRAGAGDHSTMVVSLRHAASLATGDQHG